MKRLIGILLCCALLQELAQCSPREKRTALGLLSTYLRSLGGDIDQ